MNGITSEVVKKLRDMTGAGIMDCKRALEENDGDIEKAIAFLRKKGAATAAKRADKETKQGLVEAYIHAGGRIAAMVELNCETDFVAKTQEFKQLAHELAMQVAAMSPVCITKEEFPQDFVEKEFEIYKEQVINEGKTSEIAEQLAKEKVDKLIQEGVLLEQSFIKDSGKTIKDLIDEITGKVGEKIVIRRYQRY